MTPRLDSAAPAASAPAALPAAVRLGPISLVLRPAMLLITVALATLLLGLFCADIIIGAAHLSFGQVLEVFSGGGTRAQRFLILESRLPRASTAVVVGAGLGISGAILQSLLHNPLAAPDLLGITSGAAFAAVAVLAGTGGASTGLAITVGTPVAALAGGIGVALAIYVLAWGRSPTGDPGASGLRIVLIGVGMNALLVWATSWVLARATLDDAARAQRWMTGSLNSASQQTLIPAVCGLLIVGLICVGSARTLAALRLSTDTTRALGVRIQTQQGVLIAAAVLGTSVATAAAGPIAFVGLAGPQIARGLLRTPGEPLLASGLVGGILVVAADIASRSLFPVELPVGIVTAAIGGPFLLFLLVRLNRKATL